MTHRDGLPRFSALSVRCGDAGHREACAKPSESLGKPPFGSVRLNLQDVKTPMAGILRPSVHTTRPGRLRGSA